RRVVLIWEEREEPWLYAATFDDGAFGLERIAPGRFEPIDTSAVRNTSFYVRPHGQPVLVYDPARSSVDECDAEPFGRAFRLRFGVHSAIAASLESETLAAHMVIPQVRAATADDLALAHIVGRLVLATLEQFFFVQQVRLAASAEERLRISRELHDGIVQSLGGAGLQLQAIRRQLPADFPASERLGHVQRVIEHDQRELRAIVRELRPHDVRDGRTILEDELQRMAERFPLEWGLAVDLDVALPLDVPPRLAHELSRIVNESLSNAARHGGASQATVTLGEEDGEVRLRVTDNGRGFSFSGRYDLDALTRSGSGPRTLKERVKALGGSLTVESSAGGASIDARLPVRRESEA
ncbi:MAG TPA: sensor histidine kinase, partial [Thermoanaerobaculia bacterium]|nr:sensor histidine kinase [Thermoanaerobaculia bacterium]